MIKMINGVEYTSIDIGGIPSNYIVSKNLTNQNPQIHIEHEIDGVPVLSIKERAFVGSNQLQVIELPDSLFRIGNSAFANCKNLTKVVFYKTSAENSDSSLTIGHGAFSSCMALVEIDTIKPLHLNGQSIFENCMSLQKLNNGNLLVGSIYAFDFYNCQRIKDLRIIGSRCRLWTDCFTEARNLYNIRFDCDFVQAPKSVLRWLSKRKLYCKSKCNLAELAYAGTNIYILD